MRAEAGFRALLAADDRPAFDLADFAIVNSFAWARRFRPG
jgi:hypothetical protein